MLLYGIIILWLPQFIAFASFLFIFFQMLKAWRTTGNKGFLFLAILYLVGELHYLGMKFGGWLIPAAFGMHGVVFNTWLSAILGASGAAAWWMLNKHKADRDAQQTSNGMKRKAGFEE